MYNLEPFRALKIAFCPFIVDLKVAATPTTRAFECRRRKRHVNRAANFAQFASSGEISMNWENKDRDTHTQTHTGSQTQCLCSSEDNSAIASNYLLTNKIQKGKHYQITVYCARHLQKCGIYNKVQSKRTRKPKGTRKTFRLRQASTSFGTLLPLSRSFSLFLCLSRTTLHTDEAYTRTPIPRYICHLFRDDTARKSTN